VKNGFTLIETVITLAIMATLTVMTARTIQQALKSKVKIQEQIDNVTQVRDSLKLMEKDVQLAFHAYDLEKETAILLMKEKKKSGPPPPGVPPGAPPIPPGPLAPPPSPESAEVTPEELANTTQGQGGAPNPYLKEENRTPPTTEFIGKESEMHFVTANTVRFSKDSPQSDVGEIGYLLDSCKHKADKEKFESGKCLFRRFSPLTDKDVTRGGRRMQLLENVEKFELKYYSSKKKDWVDTWSSEKTADDSTKFRYPEAVQITLAVKIITKATAGKPKTLETQIVVPIHFPNNPESPKNDKKTTGTN
jgi:prepilin-type N-terminal cleavage/methylation domain-containing protein